MCASNLTRGVLVNCVQYNKIKNIASKLVAAYACVVFKQKHDTVECMPE